jgi:hypothetical protein
MLTHDPYLITHNRAYDKQASSDLNQTYKRKRDFFPLNCPGNKGLKMNDLIELLPDNIANQIAAGEVITLLMRAHPR